MDDRGYFAEPKDVTQVYRERVESAPRRFGAVLVLWAFATVLTAPLSTLWQLIDAIVLVVVFVGYYPSLFEHRKKYLRALKKGLIVKETKQTDDRLEQVTRSATDPETVVEVAHIQLDSVIDLRVMVNTVWVGGTHASNTGAIQLNQSDFRDKQSQREFITMVLDRMQSPPRTM